MVSESLFLKERKLLKHYLTSWIFLFDIWFFAIAVFLLIFPSSLVLGIVSFVISTCSIVTLYRNLKIIKTVYINSYRKKQYWNMIQVFLFNIWILQIFSLVKWVFRNVVLFEEIAILLLFALLIIKVCTIIT